MKSYQVDQIDFADSGHEREVPSAENLGALREALRYEEEVERHIQKNNLLPGDAALYIWSRGSQGQKVAMLRRLEKNLPEIDPRRMTQLIKEMNDSMWSQDVSVQTIAPEILRSLLAHLSQLQRLEVLSGCVTMLGVSNIEVRSAWQSLVLNLVEVFPTEILEKQIVPLTLKKSEHSEPSDQRVLCSLLIGALCKRFDKDLVMSTVFSRAMALCQDTDIKMRAAMCAQLGNLARAVGLDISKERITAELLELLSDEEKPVSRAAFSCLIDIMDFFDASYRRSHLYPIIRGYLQHPPSEIQSLLAEEFGRLLLKLKSDIQLGDTSIDVSLFASYYKQCAVWHDSDIRRSAAFNFPAVVLCLPLSAHSSLLSAMKSMATDAQDSVRRAVSAGMHELIPLLGDRAAYFLRDPFTQLIQDQNMEVRHFLFRYLHSFLQLFALQLKGDERSTFFAGIVPGLCSYAQAYGNRDWRKISWLLAAMEPFPDYFNSETLHERFIPILLSYIKSGASCLKGQCAHLIAYLASRLSNPASIADVFSKVVGELRRSPSCYHRAAFLLVVRETTNYFSRRFVRERFADSLIELQKDPVVMVRCEVARTCADWKKCLRGDLVEKSHIDAFGVSSQRLLMDEDASVRTLARASLDKLASLEAQWIKPGGEDERDRQREAKEGVLVDIVREQRNTERRHKLKELLRENELVDVPVARRVSSGVRSTFGMYTATPPPSIASKAGSAGRFNYPLGGAGRVRTYSHGGNKRK